MFDEHEIVIANINLNIKLFSFSKISKINYSITNYSDNYELRTLYFHRYFNSVAFFKSKNTVH